MSPKRSESSSLAVTSEFLRVELVYFLSQEVCASSRSQNVAGGGAPKYATLNGFGGPEFSGGSACSRPSRQEHFELKPPAGTFCRERRHQKLKDRRGAQLVPPSRSRRAHCPPSQARRLAFSGRQAGELPSCRSVFVNTMMPIEGMVRKPR